MVSQKGKGGACVFGCFQVPCLRKQYPVEFLSKISKKMNKKQPQCRHSQHFAIEVKYNHKRQRQQRECSYLGVSIQKDVPPCTNKRENYCSHQYRVQNQPARGNRYYSGQRYCPRLAPNKRIKLKLQHKYIEKTKFGCVINKTKMKVFGGSNKIEITKKKK